MTRVTLPPVANVDRPTYHAWRNMIRRCEDPRTASFQYCGARGIKVCDRWRWSFGAFVEDLGVRPDSGFTLGRIDNDGHYESGNVEWQTQAEQARNTRAAVFVTIDDERLHLREAVARYSPPGLSPRAVATRINRLHWPVMKALVTPPTRAQRGLSSLGVSGYRGVSRCRNRWRATVMVDGAQKSAGYHATPEEAADAYDRLALELLGDKAELNRRSLPESGRASPE